MTSTAVVSAIYGNYDPPKPVLADESVDEWVLVTDNPLIEAPGWRIVVTPSKGWHPRLAAKIPKCLPHLFTTCERSLWVDGSMTVQPGGVELAFSGEPLWAMHTHPARNDIRDEANVSATMVKYHGEPVSEQVTHYQSQGCPQPSGLWATGVIARIHTAKTARVGEEWLLEQIAWSYQDQLSFPWVRHRNDLQVSPIAAGLYDQAVTAIGGHAHEH